MTTITQAIAATKSAYTSNVEWWSEFQPRPTPTQLSDSCVTWFLDQSRKSGVCPLGEITHVGVAGQVYDFGKCNPGNESGDGRWYQPIIYDGAQVSGGVPYPACYDLLGVPTLVRSNAELVDVVLATTGVLPVVTNISGVAVVGYNASAVDPFTLPPVELEPLLSVTKQTAKHSSPNTDSFNYTCPPPAEIGGPGFPPIGTNGYTLTVKNNPPISHNAGSVSNIWIGPITVSCGAPLLKFTIEVDADDDNGGFTVIDSNGTIIGVVGDVASGTPYTSSDCTPNPTGFAFREYNIGPETAVFQTSEVVLPGKEYWLHPIRFRGKISGVTVEAIV